MFQSISINLLTVKDGMSSRLGTAVNSQQSSAIGELNYHYVMFEISKYINNVEIYGILVPPYHSTIVNTCHVQK